MKKLYTLVLVCMVALLLPGKVLAQFDIPEKPDFQTSLYDYANILSAEEKQQLENKLVRYSDTTSTQIVIATVKDLKGDSASRVAPDWAQTWGIGQAKEDNGIFILVSVEDRDMYIATGYGVQGRLPAGTVGTIIRSYITPEFKNGDYYAGLNKGADAIFQALNGKFKGERESESNSGGAIGILFFIFVIVIIVVLAAIFGKKGGGGSGGSRGGGLDLTDILILSSLGSGRRSSGSGWGGGSWGGGSSGGFGGGFGGGGFSGGGAGGSW